MASISPSIRQGSRLAAFAALITLFLAGCTAGPNYVRPPVQTPPGFKEAGNWKPAVPSDAIAKGNWWTIYNDTQLNSLEAQIDVSNQTLQAAQAQFAGARAALKLARSPFYPSVSVAPSASRVHQSSNRAVATSSTVESYGDLVLPVDVSYEPDLWGRVLRSVEAGRAEAQATAADLANVSLSLHAELALDYFELRGLDTQKQLLDSTVAADQKELDLTTSRYKGGIASEVDVAQAQTQLESTRALDTDLAVNRASLEHAIAVLVGRPAALFTVAPLSLTVPPPAVPTGLPSDLLERRPDVAAAERRVQEANAEIGAIRAAYYPAVTLTGSAGVESAAITTLFQGPAGFWALAGQAAESIYSGGRRHALTQQARAAYDLSVDNYRQTVLTAFQEVEDSLAALRILEQETATEGAAVAAAQRSLALSNNRYKGGVASYLEVITAQSAALSAERTAVDILTRRMAASVLLIKALGGGWSISRLPHV